jgi:hypothetical protein
MNVAEGEPPPSGMVQHPPVSDARRSTGHDEPKEKQVRPDADAIRRDYELGQLTNQQVAEKHGISVAALKKRALRNRWSRALARRVEADTNARLAAAEAGLSPTVSGEISNKEIEDALVSRAVDGGVAAVQEHRRQLAKLHGIIDAAMTHLQLHIVAPLIGRTAAQCLEGEAPVRPSALSVDVLRDLAVVLRSVVGALSDVIRLERQTYGLDRHDQLDDGFDDVIRAIATAERNRSRVGAPRLGGEMAAIPQLLQPVPTRAG